ncbi:hypothetical protein RHODO2019_19090 (plasmid) [Rhodococcus antarcticus]|uniref:Uncharacterized protein n=1 Tax=Rhodococcus antarcticus TaxID=2987751 RepID=A0ABY6P6S6_9NOCA|nr:hypothetical protein [Rhodococcus antarcticus]UZJ27066.1 hypothetical protein RHODO2019_19090 [Rhodococcus antarcticus]
MASSAGDLSLSYDPATMSVRVVAGSGPADWVVVAGLSSVVIQAGARSVHLGTSVRLPPVALTVAGSGTGAVLYGPSVDTSWTITGTDVGTVAGVAFAGFAHLVGAAGSVATFTVQPGGSVVSLDGGGAGALVVAGQQTFQDMAVDKHSGTVVLNGTPIRYAGLAPITITPGTTVVTITGTSGDDAISVSQAGGTVTVSAPTMESVTFTAAGTSKIVINGGGGYDSVSFATSLLLTGAELDVTAEQITVSGVTINTGNAPINFQAVASDTGTTTVGTVTATPTTSITLSGATVDASSITLVAASTATPTSAAQVNVVNVTSSAIVSITDSTITATGDVTVSSASTVNASAVAQGPLGGTDAVDAAFSKLDVTSTAQSNLSGTTTFTVGGALTVSASTENTNLTTNGNALLAGAGAGVALATLHESTTAYIDAHSTGNTAGSVAISATTGNTITTSAAASPDGATANTDATGAAITPAQFLGAVVTALSPLVAAGALAVANLTVDTQAYLAPNGGAFGLTTGDVVVHAGGATDAQTAADGHAVLRTALGIGVAVAIDISHVTTSAYVGGTTTLTATRLTIEAPASAETFGTTAKAGAGTGVNALGASSTAGFEGSFAMNIVTVTHTATISDNATLTLTTPAGVSLASEHTTESTTKAIPTGNYFSPTAVANNTITLSLPLLHTNGTFAGLPAATGDKVVYNNGGGTSIGGLTALSTYYLYCGGPLLTPCLPDATGAVHVQLISGSLLLPTFTAGEVLPLDPTVAAGDFHFLQLVEKPTDSMGVGAGVAVNIVNDAGTAAVGNGASLVGAASLGLTASTTDTMTLLAKAGSSGATVAITPVVSVAVSNVATNATIGTGATLVLAGGLRADATQAARVDSGASGDTTSDAGIGISVVVNDVDHEVHATTARSLTIVGDIALSATGTSATSSLTWAGTAGAPASNTSPFASVNAAADNFLGMGNTLAGGSAPKGGKDSATPTAGSADSSGTSISAAAAISFNLVRSVSDTTVPSGVTLTVTGGALRLASSGNTDTSAVSDGETGTGGATAAIGAGVALNFVTIVNTADVTGGATITADGLEVSARMTPVSATGSTDCTAEGTDCVNSATAQAISAAAGGGSLGINGSVALNIISSTTSAQLTSSGPGVAGTTVAAGGGTVKLDAATDTDAVTSAIPFRNAFDPATSIIADPTSTSTKLTTIVLAYELVDGNLKTGQAVAYHTGGKNPIGIAADPLCLSGVCPSTLVNNRTYFAIVVKPGYFQLASTCLGALLGKAMVLNPTVATGSAHYFVSKALQPGDVCASSGADDAPKMGIGASFALTIDNVTTTAGIGDGVTVTGGGSVDIAAEDGNAADTSAVSGADGGSTGLSPSVALVIANLGTTAYIGAGAVLELSGDVTLAATQHARAVTEGSGDVNAETTGVALAVAVVVAADDVRAFIARDVTADGAVSLSAVGASATKTSTDAAAPGAPSSSTGGINAIADKDLGQGNLVSTGLTGKGAPKTKTPTAGDGDTKGSSLSVAGAFTVNVVETTSRAYFTDHLTITSATGAVTLASSANTDVTGEGNGQTASKVTNGIGAGVVVNDVTMTNVATTGASAVTSVGLEVTATMTPVTVAGGGAADVTHTVEATAKAGSSNTEKLGAAGALAINIVTADTEATAPTGATIHAGTGSLVLKADYREDDAANASARAGFKTCAQFLGLPCDLSTAITGQDSSGTGTGVGASVAIQVFASTTTLAEIGDGVSVTAGGEVGVEAASERAITTLAEAGTKGGTAVSPSLALVVDTGDTATARIGTSPTPLGVAGAVTIAVTHSVDASATGANANVVASGVGVGAAVALPIVISWTTSAELARSVTADAVTVTAASDVAVGATANASAIGSSSKDSGGTSADATTTSAVTNDPNAGGKGANSPPSANTSATQGGAKSTGKAGKSGGGVGVAAAIAVTWVQTSTTATVDSSLTIAARGALTVEATQLSTVAARGLGIALDPNNAKTNIGAGLGFNYLDATVTASTGSGDHLSGKGITVSAGTPRDSATGEPAQNTVISWGFAASGGKTDPQVAGSVALNVIAYRTTAEVGLASVLGSTGGLTVSAVNPMGLQNLAAAGALSQGGVAVGAAIAINILTPVTTVAEVDSSLAQLTTLDAAGALTVSAESSLGELGVDLSRLGSMLLSNLVNVPGVALIPAPGAGSAVTEPAVSSVAVAGAAGTGTASVAGSFIVDVWERTTDAHIGDGAQINQSGPRGGASQTLTVHAADHIQETDIAGGLGVTTGSVGVGAAVVVGVVDQTVTAYLGAKVVAAAGGAAAVTATATDPILVVAASAGAGDEVGASGSILVLVLNSAAGTGTYAWIGASSSVHTGADLAVTATGNGANDTIGLYAGSVAIGGTAGVGISASVLVRSSTVSASIGTGDVLTSDAGSVTVGAQQVGAITLVAFGGAAGGEAGVAGSAVVDVLTDSTLASVGSGAHLTAAQDVGVAASDLTTILGVAGSVAIGGTAGVGAGVDTEVITKDTVATVGASVPATSTTPAAVTMLTATHGNITVTATSSETITSISAGGSVGGDVAIALNAGVSVLNITTTSTIGNGAQLWAGNNIVISADDAVHLDVIAGNIAVSGTASVGAAVAVPVVIKHVEATVGNNVTLTAMCTGSATTASTGAFTSVTPDIRFDPRTAVHHDPNAPTPADPSQPSGNWIVLTTSAGSGYTEGERVLYDNGGGTSLTGLTPGGTYYIHRVAAGCDAASICVELLNAANPPPAQLDSHLVAFGIPAGDTSAYGESQRLVPADRTAVAADSAPRFNPATDVTGTVIYLPYPMTKQGTPSPLSTGDAIVYSSGGGTPIGNLVDGQTYYVIVLGAGYYTGTQRIELAATACGATGLAADCGTAKPVAPISLDAAVATGASHSIVLQGQRPSGDASAENPATTTAGRGSFSGIAVTATSVDDIAAVGVSASVSGSVAIGVTGSAGVLSTTTHATIGAGTTVTSAGSVAVSAAESFHQLGIDASVAIAGDAAVAVAVTLHFVTLDTQATVGSDSVLTATAGDLVISAATSDTVVSVAAGLAGGQVGVAGVADVTSMTNTTHAGTADHVTLYAGNNVLVAALDHTDLISVAAAIGVGVYAGVGASVGVALVTKDTEAYLGTSNIVNALAHGGALGVLVADGSTTSTGFGTATGVHGVAVVADSTERLFGLAAALGAGFVGAAGGISIRLFTMTTTATVGASSIVNNVTGADAAQSVTVAATDNFDAISIAGGAGLGAVGAAGAVDVGVANATVTAGIGDHATVNAMADVAVIALSRQHVITFAISVGLGAVGIAVSVAVWTLGAAPSATYDDSAAGTDKGAWSASTSYNAGDRVELHNIRWAAKDAVAAGVTPGTGNWVAESGLGGDKGTWVSGAQYHQGDVVEYGDYSYAALVDTTGTTTPGSATGIWTLQQASNALHSGGADTGGQSDTVASSSQYGNALQGSHSNDRGSWSSGATYATNDVVLGSDNNYYSSKLDGNTGNDPTSASSSSSWAQIDPSGYAVSGYQSGGLASAQAALSGGTPQSGSVAGALGATTPPAGTSAYLGGTVVAGGNILVTAHDAVDILGITGSLSGGLGAIGASILILNVQNPTTAGVGQYASLTAGGAITVSAGTDETTLGLAIAGAAGVVTLGAQVVVINDSSSQNAHVDAGASLLGAGAGATVSAHSYRSVTADPIGVAISGLAIGASVGIVNVSGDTTATVGSTPPGPTVACGCVTVTVAAAVTGLTVSADDTTPVEVNVYSVEAGVGLGIGAAVGLANLTGTTRASSAVTGSLGSGGETVSATGDHSDVTVKSANVATGALAAVGATVALATDARDTTAQVTSGSLSTSGAVRVIASATNTATASAPGGSAGTVAITVMVPIATVTGATTAVLNGSITSSSSVLVRARAQNSANATAVIASVGIAGAGGAFADAEVSPTATITATIGSGATVFSSGAVEVDAATQGVGNNAHASAVVVAASYAASVTVVIVKAVVAGAVHARQDGTISGSGGTCADASGSLCVIAASTDTAVAETVSVSVSGGFSMSGSGELADIASTATTQATGAGTSSDASAGTIVYSASSANSATANDVLVSVGALSIGVGIPTARVEGLTNAELDGGITTAAALSVTATGANTATATAVPVAVGVVAGGGASSEADITSSAGVTATVGAGIDNVHGGSVAVVATGVNSATANASGGSAGGIAISVMLPSAHVDGGVVATFDGTLPNAGVKAGSLLVRATGSNTATATALVVSISLLGGSGASAQAYIGSTATVNAVVGTDASVAVTGATTVTAQFGTLDGSGNLVAGSGHNDATATATGGTGGILAAISVILSYAENGGGTDAEINGTITAGASLTMTSTGTNTATGTTLVVAIGTMGGGGSGTTAIVTSSAHIRAGSGSGSSINVTGAITITVTGTNTATSSSDAGAGGGVAVGVALPKAEIAGTIGADLEGNVAHADSLTMTVIGTNTATSTATPVAVGFFAGAGGKSEADIDSTAVVYSTIGGGTLTVTGAIVASATGTNTATATTKGGAGGALGLAIVFANATDNGAVTASFGATLDQAASLNVTAVGHDTASTTVFVVGIGIAGGAGAGTTASVGGADYARIASGAVIQSPTTAITVSTTHTQTANAGASGGAGGLLGVGALVSTGTVTGSTKAYVDSGVTVGTSTGRPASLDLEATDTTTSTVTATLGVGGAIAGGGASTTSTVTPTVTAYVGSGDHIALAGSLTVHAVSTRAEGNATSKSYGGGGVQVGVAAATVTTSPTVRAYLSSGVVVAVTGDVSVSAEARSAPAAGIQLGDTYGANVADVSSTDNTLYFPSHGLTTGDSVLYIGGGIPGLTSGRVYTVIAVDGDHVQLGATFLTATVNAGSIPGASGVDPNRSVIRFSTVHNFATGDAIVLGGTGVINGSVAAGQTLYVRVVDPYTIQLYTSYAAATAAAGSFSLTTTPGAVSGTTITLANSFTNGQRVTYTAPTPLAFNQAAVDVTPSCPDSSHCYLPDTSQNDIVAGQVTGQDSNHLPIQTPSGLHTGQRVQYLTTGSPVGGLVNGGYYYAIVVNQYVIQLAATEYDTTAHTYSCGSNTCTDPVKPIAISAPTTDTGVSQIIPAPIGGLTDGYTYTVANPTSSSFTLKDGTGHAITLSTTTTSSGNAGSATVQDIYGTQQFFATGLALTGCSASCTADSVAIDLGAATGGTYGLYAPSSPVAGPYISLRQLSPPAGDGQSSSSAAGGGGGVISVNVPTASLTDSPIVQAYLAGTVTAGGNVAVTSALTSNDAVSSDNGSGGFIAVGVVSSTLTVHAINTASFGPSSDSGIAGDSSSIQVDGSGTTVTAGGNVAVAATTARATNAYAHSEGGGFAGGFTAHDSTTVTDNTAAVVGAGAHVSGATVAVLANSSGNDQMYAKARMYALFGVTSVTGGITVTSNDTALLDGTSGSAGTITGRYGVDVRAWHHDVTYNDNHDSTCVCIGPSHDSSGTNVSLNNTVAGHQGVTVYAGPRLVPGVNESANAPASPLVSNGDGKLVLYVQSENSGGTVQNDHTSRNVSWNSDVVVNSGPDPYLVVNPDGTVAVAINVTVNGVANPNIGAQLSGTVTVGDIINSGSGDIYMTSNGGSINGGSCVGGSNGNQCTGGHYWGTFTFRQNFTSVTLINNSTLPMVVNNIDVIDERGTPKVTLNTSPGSNNVSATFALQQVVTPSLVVIDTTSASDLTLLGTITNPIGETDILNLGGSVLSGTVRGGLTGDGHSQLIVTNVLHLEATAGSIGSATDRVNVDMIQFAGHPLTITATAGVDLYLDLRSWLRDPSVPAAPLSLTVGDLVAGRDLDVLLQATVYSSGTSQVPGVLVVVPSESLSRNVFNFFRPDYGSPTVFAIGASAGATTAVASTYTFSELDSGSSAVNGNGSITVAAANDAASATRLNIIGFVQVHQHGNLNVDTNGFITLTELVVADTAVHVVIDTALPPAATGFVRLNDASVAAGPNLDLRAGVITSTDDDVTLYAPYSIVDAPVGSGIPPVTGHSNPAQNPQVVGVTITMTAGTSGAGTIGSNTNFLEINSSVDRFGVLNAQAPGVIRVTETSGDLHVDTVSTCYGTSVTTCANISVTADTGSILDGHNAGAGGTAANIIGNTVDLQALGGSVGSSGVDLKLNSANGSACSNAYTFLYQGPNYADATAAQRAVTARCDIAAQADGSVYLTETNGPANVLLALARHGNVRITTPLTTTDGNAILLLHSGTTLVVENAPQTVPYGLVEAMTGNVTLYSADDVVTDPSAQILATTAPADPGTGVVNPNQPTTTTGTIDIYGDHHAGGDVAGGYPDGTVIVLRGTVTPGAGGLTRVFGNAGNDLIVFDQTVLGGNTRAFGSAVPSAANSYAPAGDGEDTFVVYKLTSMPDHTVLALDGQDGSDHYVVWTHGTHGTATSYVIDVLDSGAPAAGLDTLDVYGADSTQNGIDPTTGTAYPTDDLFLLRSQAYLPGRAATGPPCTAGTSWVRARTGRRTWLSCTRRRPPGRTCCRRPRPPATTVSPRPSTTTWRSTVASVCLAWAATTTSPSTTPWPRPPSTGVPAMTTSRSASCTACGVTRSTAGSPRRCTSRLSRRPGATCPRATALRWWPRVAAATTRSPSTPTTPQSASRATTATTCSSSRPSRWRRPPPTGRSSWARCSPAGSRSPPAPRSPAPTAAASSPTGSRSARPSSSRAPAPPTTTPPPPPTSSRPSPRRRSPSTSPRPWPRHCAPPAPSGPSRSRAGRSPAAA